MRALKVRSLAAAILLIVMLPLFAGPLAATEQSARVRTAAILRDSTVQGPTTTELLLRQEIELLRSHNADLRSLLLWALAFAATFLLGFAALIGFLTSRRYEQDKQALETLLAAGVDRASAQAEKRLADWQTETLRVLNERFANLSTTLSSTARDSAKIEVERLANDIAALRRSLTVLQSDLLENNAAQYATAGNSAMAVTGYLRLAEHAWQNKSDYTLTRALEQIQKQLDKGGYLTADEKVRAAALLDSLPTKYAPLVAAIRAAKGSAA